MNPVTVDVVLLCLSIMGLALAIPRFVEFAQEWRSDKRDREELKHRITKQLEAAEKELQEAVVLLNALKWGAPRGLVRPESVKPVFERYKTRLRIRRITGDRFRRIIGDRSLWTQEELYKDAGEACLEEQQAADFAEQRYEDKELRESVLRYLGEFKTPKEGEYLVLLGFKDEPQEGEEKQAEIVQK
jgi:hypothetical protein